MKRFNHKLTQATESDLARVVEPLASYISATNQPKAAMIAALAVLVSEVKKTNRVAQLQVTNYMEKCRS